MERDQSTMNEFQHKPNTAESFVGGQNQEIEASNERLEVNNGTMRHHDETPGGVSLGNFYVSSFDPDGIDYATIERKYTEKLAEKNGQIRRLLEDLHDLERINLDLVDHVKKLKDELNQASQTIDAVGNDMSALRISQKEYQDLNERLSQSNSILTEQVEELKKMILKSEQEDQILTDIFDKKLDQMNAIIAKKDEEIERLKADSKLVMDLFGEQWTSDDWALHGQKKLVEVVSIIREKDNQLDLLRAQLQQATADIQKQSDIIERMKSENEKSVNDLNSDKMVTKTNQENGSNENSKDIVRQLEEELIHKQTMVEDLQRRVYYYEYEISTPSSEAKLDDNNNHIEADNELKNRLTAVQQLLNELEALKKQMHMKDERITDLVDQLNGLNSRHELIESQLDLVRSSMDPASFENFTKASRKSDEATIKNGFTNEVSVDGPIFDRSNDADQYTRGKLEIDVPQLLERLRQLEDENIKLLCLLREERKMRPDKIQDTNANSSSNDDKESNAIEDSLRKRMAHLEFENQQLHLAMKEILVSIQSTDGHCGTIIIDCPSLEKLCSMMETQYIVDEASSSKSLTNSNAFEKSSNNLLFHLVTIKAELDIVRGQNEQLRSDMKLIRDNHHSLLKHSLQRAHNESSQSRGDNTGHNEHVQSVNQPQQQFVESTLQTNEIQSQNQVSHNENQPFDDDKHQDKQLAESGESDQLEQMPSKPQEISLLKESVDDSDVQSKITQSQNIETKSERENDAICKKCVELERQQSEAQFTTHLLTQFIMKIENNVRLNEHNYVRHIELLRRQVQELERFLSVKETILRETQIELNMVRDQKCTIEKLLSQSAQTQKEPETDSAIESQSKDRDQSTSEIKPEHGIINPMTPDDNQTFNSANIKVLQTIVECLQARLDHKQSQLDETEHELQRNKESYEQQIEVMRQTVNDLKVQLSTQNNISRRSMAALMDKCNSKLESSKVEIADRVESLEMRLKSVMHKLVQFEALQDEPLHSGTHRPMKDTKTAITTPAQLRTELNQQNLCVSILKSNLKDAQRHIKELTIERNKLRDTLQHCQKESDSLKRRIYGNYPYQLLSDQKQNNVTRTVTPMLTTKSRRKIATVAQQRSSDINKLKRIEAKLNDLQLVSSRQYDLSLKLEARRCELESMLENCLRHENELLRQLNAVKPSNNTRAKKSAPLLSYDTSMYSQ